MAQLRPATPADGPFCYSVHKQALQEYVSAIYGPWDEAVQEHFHQEWFDPSRIQIIESNGTPIGVFDVTDSGHETYVSRIELLPEWQGRGIGSAIVDGLTARGPVELDVLVSNPRARALYERLGFDTVSEHDGRVSMRHPGPGTRR